MNNHPGKILVIEEPAASRSDLCDFLESRGYSVIGPDSAATAAATALAVLPDLIFVDLSTDRSLEVIYKIRQKNELSDIPVLASSADGGFGIELYSNIDRFGKGYIGYLTEPVSFNDLADQISSILLRQKKAA